MHWKSYQETVDVDQNSLDLTRVRYKSGLDTMSGAQAEIALESAKAAATTRNCSCAYEHAIATARGEPASTFSVPVRALTTQVPDITGRIPSELWKDGPDIAAAERTMAEANALIGVQKAAYYPTLSITVQQDLKHRNFRSG